MAGDRDRFAMMPESLIVGSIPGISAMARGRAILVYAYLDLRQGDRGRPARGYRKVARALGLQERTVSKAVHDLATAGLVELEALGQSQVVIRVIHNPARGVVNPDVELGPPAHRASHEKREAPDTLSRDAQEDPVARDASAVGALVPRDVQEDLGLQRSDLGLGWPVCPVCELPIDQDEDPTRPFGAFCDGHDLDCLAAILEAS